MYGWCRSLRGCWVEGDVDDRLAAGVIGDVVGGEDVQAFFACKTAWIIGLIRR
jgi:hypothetical protein